MEEYKEKQDDDQNGGDAAKIASKHVCFINNSDSVVSPIMKNVLILLCNRTSILFIF